MIPASQSETFNPYIVADIALNLGARCGIYLGGGIFIFITDYLLKSDFMQDFIDIGKVQGYLEDIPVSADYRRQFSPIGGSCLVV